MRESEFVHENIINSTLEVLEGMGHCFIIEGPEKTLTILSKFSLKSGSFSLTYNIKAEFEKVIK